MNWNVRSKRFLVVLFASAFYAAALCISHELFEGLTPYVFGFWAAYCGFESWRPAGMSCDGLGSQPGAVNGG